MIPVSLYGIDADMCERFYSELPELVADSIEDEHYAKAIFSIQENSHSPIDWWDLHCRYFNETVHHDLFHNKIIDIKEMPVIYQLQWIVMRGLLKHIIVS